VDFAFKWLFGRERSLPLLINLLNAVLKPLAGCEIAELELLNPFSEQDSAEDKLSIVDVKARDKRGHQFDVEMQLLADRAFCKRVLYYWAGLHLQQLSAGDLYSRLCLKCKSEALLKPGLYTCTPLARKA
jgi:predicted transposase/invertase (TIGR01784 family)